MGDYYRRYAIEYKMREDPDDKSETSYGRNVSKTSIHDQKRCKQ